MQVKCLGNSAEALPDMYFEHGYTKFSSFDLDVGNTYSVYGISRWVGLLLYLVVGRDQRPHWYPAELFQVTRTTLGSGWHFNFFGAEDQITAIWGFQELVNDSEYHDRLANLEPDALEKFEMRRKEMDE